MDYMKQKCWKWWFVISNKWWESVGFPFTPIYKLWMNEYWLGLILMGYRLDMENWQALWWYPFYPKAYYTERFVSSVSKSMFIYMQVHTDAMHCTDGAIYYDEAKIAAAWLWIFTNQCGIYRFYWGGGKPPEVIAFYLF